MLAKLRFDIGYNKELKFKLTPENQLPLYVQHPSASIHLRDKNFDELAILQSFYTITTLSYSECSSPIFIHLKTQWYFRSQNQFIEITWFDISVEPDSAWKKKPTKYTEISTGVDQKSKMSA